ncbi:MAG: GTPase ObgE [Spirochaetales bacterium]|jgi:GTP-binding protein|nr:GTPase ObgE [Spirochaetales bacterium]
MESRFVDETIIEVCSGDGGDGVVHFRREKYIPRGGPDGGDGGDGGDALFVVRKNLKTLSYLKMRHVFRGEKGKPGGGQRKSGRRGQYVEIPVPPGTLAKDPDSGVLLHDMHSQDEPWLFLRGGRGGRGNWHFKSSTRQAPRFAESGQKGVCRRVLVELALIADIGLVGKPNAGKSTLLSVLTNSHPKIGAYPFTTKIPNIGVCSLYDYDIVLADIPGIIEGASQGAGLGFQFLKHIGRTNLILFLIDLHDNDPGLSYHMLEKELGTYREELTRKPRLVVGTKMDLDGAGDRLSELRAAVRDQDCLGISAVTGSGIDELKRTLFHAVGRHR